MDAPNTFLKADPRDAEPMRLIADHLLTGLAGADRINTLETAFLAATKAHNDETALCFVQLLHGAYDPGEDVSLPYPERRRKLELERQASCARRIANLYWQMPAHRLGAERRRDHPLDEKDRWYRPHEPTLQKTKKWMVERVAGYWGADLTDENVALFRFLVAAGFPERKDQGRLDGESDDEMTARGRLVSKDETEAVLQAIRKRTDRDCEFPAGKLEAWLGLRHVPGEIRHILTIARTRNGGIPLAERDIRYAQILAPLKVEERGYAGLDLYNRLCEQVSELDAAATALLKRMQPERGSWDSDMIGRSEYVRGGIWLNLPDLETIEVTVTLYHDTSVELGQDIFGRARRHIEAFCAEHTDRKLTVNLALGGGQGSISLTHRCSTKTR